MKSNIKLPKVDMANLDELTEIGKRESEAYWRRHAIKVASERKTQRLPRKRARLKSLWLTKLANPLPMLKPCC